MPIECPNRNVGRSSPTADRAAARSPCRSSITARFYADVVRRMDAADREALYQGDPTLGQDGGAEEDRKYRDESATVGGAAELRPVRAWRRAAG